MELILMEFVEAVKAKLKETEAKLIL